MRVTTLTGALALCVLLTAACSDSNSSLNPTGPSAIASRSLAASTAEADAGGVATGTDVDGGTISALGKGGNGKGKDDRNDNDKGKGNDRDDDRGAPPPGNSTPPTPTAPTAPAKVELEGLIAAVNPSARTIDVNDRRVTVPETARIRHGSTNLPFSVLQVGDRVHVKATALGSLIEASEVKRQNPGDDDGDDDGEDDEDDDDDNATLPGVNVAATDASAAEVGANTATFRLTRNGDALLLAAPLTVTFALSGTAVNGTDYQLLPATATFPAGQAVVDVVVTPLGDALVEGPEVVAIVLTSAVPYPLGTQVSAVATIADTPVVTAEAVDPAAAEAGPDTGRVRFTRTGSTAASLAVLYTVSGTAQNGVDYEPLASLVTIPAGQAFVEVVITPVADAAAEGPETVSLTVSDGAAYNVGTPASATVTITG